MTTHEIGRWAAQVLFTDRSGGVSRPPFNSANLAEHVGDDPADVAVNRQRLGQQLGVDRLVWLSAQHGGHVAVVGTDDQDIPQTVQADAVVTNQTGIGLVALGADCVTATMFDRRNGVIAAMHCGWRGLVAGIVTNTLEAMVDLGAEPEAVDVQLGPAICGQCYGVPDARAHEVGGYTPAALTRARDGQVGISVPAGVCEQLARRSVSAVANPHCTFEDDRWFSYRRDGRTGRHAAAIALQSVGNHD